MKMHKKSLGNLGAAMLLVLFSALLTMGLVFVTISRSDAWADDQKDVSALTLGGGEGSADTRFSAYYVPTAYVLPNGDKAISASPGYTHVGVVTSNGLLYTWGLNETDPGDYNVKLGVLGNGTTNNASVPEAVASDIVRASMGLAHGAAIKKDKTLWTWGSNSHGAVGDGTTINRLSPTKIMSDVIDVQVGPMSTMALKKDGSVWTWGFVKTGFDYTTSPEKVMDGAKAIAASGSGAGRGTVFAAIKKDGSLWVWGYSFGDSEYDDNGEIVRYAETVESLSPVKVADAAVSVDVSWECIAYVDKNGVLRSAGTRAFLSRTGSSSSFKVVANNVEQVIVNGERPSYALIKKDATLWAWGDNQYGQLGDGTTADRENPVKVLDNVRDCSLSGLYGIATCYDGTVWGWGNVVQKRASAVQIVASTQPVKLIDVSDRAVSEKWVRLDGRRHDIAKKTSTRWDTMADIVTEGWDGTTGGTVVVARGDGTNNFRDALAAGGVAGFFDAPVITIDPTASVLTKQAADLLAKLKPSRIIVAGGSKAIPDSMVREVEKAAGIESGSAIRMAGGTSAQTSAALCSDAVTKLGMKWSDTAFIATNASFRDALSAAPISYRLHMPILLADGHDGIDAKVIKALKTAGIKKVILLGSKYAVSAKASKRLTDSGIKIEGRLEGVDTNGRKTGVATSRAIANWGVEHGMSQNYMGVATSQSAPDALAGAALCGLHGGVIVLADDKSMLNADYPGTAAPGTVKCIYVFGSEKYAVGKKTWDTLVASTK